MRGRLDYLAELGVSYLHLMPLLRPRAGDSDGGYAVADYDAVDPRLGTMADLEELAADLHARGMALCIDLVLNHTAREHDWARQAAAGDPAYQRHVPDLSRTGPSPTRTSGRCPRCSRTPRPAASPRCQAWAGSGRRSTTTSGT